MAALATTLSGACALLGALAVAGVRRPSRSALDAMLGAAAGLMLGATFLGLLVPALEGGGTRRAVGVAVAVAAGAWLVRRLHDALPHEHLVKGREGPRELGDEVTRRTSLLVVALALHNVPEGLAVGVGLAGDAGATLAIGIGIQNVPEGLAVAAALVALGNPLRQAVGLTGVTAAVEIAAGLLGLAVASAVDDLLPWALAGAAGAMLFVISHEIVPETHRHGNEDLATTALVAGFALYVVLDAVI